MDRELDMLTSAKVNITNKLLDICRKRNAVELEKMIPEANSDLIDRAIRITGYLDGYLVLLRKLIDLELMVAFTWVFNNANSLAFEKGTYELAKKLSQIWNEHYGYHEQPGNEHIEPEFRRIYWSDMLNLLINIGNRDVRFYMLVLENGADIGKVDEEMCGHLLTHGYSMDKLGHIGRRLNEKRNNVVIEVRDVLPDYMGRGDSIDIINHVLVDYIGW
jgi:hypothetical protein